MAAESRHCVSSFPCNTIRYTLMLVLVALMCETCILRVAAENGQGRHTIGNVEVAEEIGNPATSDTGEILHSFYPLEKQDDEDFITYKRHLGAVAALAGSRPLSGSKLFVSPSKKHLGSIAAQSMGRSSGRKLELMNPGGKNEMYKRHLGAVMALSGYKQKPLTRSLKESSEYQMNSQPDILELETPPMSYIMNSQAWVDQSFPVEGNFNGVDSDIINPEEIQSVPEILSNAYAMPSEPKNENWYFPSKLGFADESALHNNEFLSMSPPQMETTVEDELLDQNMERKVEDVGAYKSKRFLGPLARGGWFPRHFRGIISENSFDKRHIGSLAKMGWIPHAKGNSRLTMLDEQRGELGLKRNDASPRRRMLYHFTAPSLWTSPRGK